MADRTVKVKLEAAVSGYVGNMRAAAAATKSFGKDVSALGKTNFEKQAKSTAAMAAGIVSLGSIGGPALGLLTALPGLTFAGAGAMTAMAMATSGVGDAMSALAAGDGKKALEAMEKLSPAAQQFAVEGREVASAWGEVQQATQESMFEKLNGSMEQMTSAHLPSMKRDLPAIAAALGEGGAGLADWASSARTVGQVSTILQGTVPVVRDLSAGVRGFADGFLTLGAESMPVVQALSGLVRTLGTDFQGWVAQAQQSGQLKAVFAETGTSVGLLGESVTNLSSAVGSLFANPATIQAANTFLQMLAGGTATVAQLAEAFASLPDGLQQFILIAGAAALAGSKLYGAYERLGVEAEKSAKSQSKLGTAMNGMGRAATMAGGALTALMVLGVGVTQLDKAFRDAAPSTEALVAGLQKINATGKGNSATVRTLGSDFKQFGSDASWLTEGGLTSAARGLSNFSQGLRQMVGIDIDFLGPFDNAKERLGQVDQALAQMVSSGNAAGAKQSFQELAAAAKEQGVSVADLMEKLPGYKSALEAAGPAATQAAVGQQQMALETKLMAGSLQQAITAVGGLKAAFDVLNGGAATSVQGMVQADTALKAFSTSLQTNGASIDENTAKGRANVLAFSQVAAAAAQAAQAKLDETGSVTQASAVYDSYIGQLRTTMTQAGFTKQQIDALIGSYAAMPALKETPVRAPGADVSKQQVDALIGSLNKVLPKSAQITTPGATGSKQQTDAVYAALQRLPKDVQIRIVTQHLDYYNKISSTGSINAASNATGTRRWGGIDYAFAGGGMTPAHIAAGTRIKYAEPATGGEAYIPRLGDMGKNRQMAKYVVDNWLGGPQAVWPSRGSVSVPKASSSGYSSGSSGGANLDYAKLARELARAMSNVTVSIDGRVAGQVEGRRANLMRRGG